MSRLILLLGNVCFKLLSIKNNRHLQKGLQEEQQTQKYPIHRQTLLAGCSPARKKPFPLKLAVPLEKKTGLTLHGCRGRTHLKQMEVQPEG